MEKIIRIIKKGNEENDINYWLSVSYVNRLRELEKLRFEVNQRIYGTQSGFQRVYRVVKRS